MLLPFHTPNLIEAGCDEAGRGCLCGPVYAAAVILPSDFRNEKLNDSKQLTDRQRYQLREVVLKEALSYGIGVVSAEEIDQINILNASILAMHRALEQLSPAPEHIIVDGNRFKPYLHVPHHTVVKGDGKYLSIASASVLAKTFRDDYMKSLAQEFPDYGWEVNMGYPTRRHREAIQRVGITEHHRKSFNLLPRQLVLFE